MIAEVEILALSYYGKDRPPPTRPALSREQEAAAFMRYRRRKTASDRETLVRQYLCWAFGMAARMKGPRLDFDEAISVANLGLMQALDRYDPSQGYRFTTYAAFWVRRQLIEAIVGTYPVHVSDHIRQKWRYASQSPEALAELQIGDEPRTLEEFFERLGDTSEVGAVERLHDRQEDAPFTPAPATSPADELELSSLPLDVKRAIRRLSLLERQAILARHYRDEPESFESIGRRLRRSKNKIREAYDSALVKLRQQLKE